MFLSGRQKASATPMTGATAEGVVWACVTQSGRQLCLKRSGAPAPCSKREQGSRAARECCAGGAPLFLSQRALDKVRARKSKVTSYNLDLNLVGDYWGWFGSRSYHHTGMVSLWCACGLLAHACRTGELRAHGMPLPALLWVWSHSSFSHKAYSPKRQRGGRLLQGGWHAWWREAVRGPGNNV